MMTHACQSSLGVISGTNNATAAAHGIMTPMLRYNLFALDAVFFPSEVRFSVWELKTRRKICQNKTADYSIGHMKRSELLFSNCNGGSCEASGRHDDTRSDRLKLFSGT